MTFPALHHEFDALQLGDVGQRIARDGDQIRVFALVDGPDLILPSQRFGVNHGSALKRPHGRQAAVLHQHFEVERLRSMRVGRTVGSAAHHDLHSLGGSGHGHGLLEDGDHPILAAGVLGIVIVHVRLDVALERGS